MFQLLICNLHSFLMCLVKDCDVAVETTHDDRLLEHSQSPPKKEVQKTAQCEAISWSFLLSHYQDCPLANYF